jgi:hypothetical protein
MFTLFGMTTLDDVSDIMYTNMYGCDVYGYGAGESLLDEGTESEVFTAVPTATPTQTPTPTAMFFPPATPEAAAKDGAGSISDEIECTPCPQFWTSSIYTMLYTTLSMQVTLSIFLGVILMAMEETRKEMNALKGIEKEVHRVVKRKPKLRGYISTLKLMFDTMDTSSDGDLDLDEIRLTLIDICAGGTFDLEYAVAVFKRMDPNGDDNVDKEEFITYMCRDDRD